MSTGTEHAVGTTGTGTPPGRANPYVGPRALQAGERLYGRAREVQEVRNLLIAEGVLFLYSPSGAGKSSLIGAALIGELQKRRFHVWPVIRVGKVPLGGVPPGANRYTLSMLLSLEQNQPEERRRPPAELAHLDLAAYLAGRRGADAPADEVLIFDQFEEVLTFDPTDQAAKAAFFAGLGEALRDRRIWALFALREEYLAGLEPYRPHLPGTAATFRLDLLGPAAAREAIQGPAREAGVEFADPAANKLVDDLRGVRVQGADGRVVEQLGPYVEPVQLQVVCRQLWERLPPGATRISADDINAVGDVDTALADYYAAQVAEVVAATGVSERQVRDWCETQLIAVSGVRGQVLETPEASEGLPNAAVEALVNTHLVRAEQREGRTWLELAHDRLIGPVRASNALWREAHFSLLQRQALLWEAQHQPPDLLLHGAKLSSAEHWAADHDGEMTPVERRFLADSRAATGRRLRLYLLAAALLLVVVVAAGFTWYEQAQTEQARSQLAAANTQLRDVNSRLQDYAGQLNGKNDDLKSALNVQQAIATQYADLLSQHQLAISEANAWSTAEAAQVAEKDAALAGLAAQATAGAELLYGVSDEALAG
jgi:hypothetical protein